MYINTQMQYNLKATAVKALADDWKRKYHSITAKLQITYLLRPPAYILSSSMYGPCLTSVSLLYQLVVSNTQACAVLTVMLLTPL